MSTPAPSAYIYIRSATREQTDSLSDAEGNSVRHQREACEAKAASLDATVIGEFVDYTSGNDPRRPELRRLLAQLRAETIGYVIVADDARLARRFTLWNDLRQTIEDSGAKLLACKPIAEVFQGNIVELIAKFAKADHRDRRMRA